MTSERDTLVVVEDDDVTRTFLADNLTADGYEVLAAPNARHAMRLLETRSVALVLLDLGLPDTDGLELLGRIRGADSHGGPMDPDVPVVVLSGRAGELERMRGWDRGCDDYVLKPSLLVIALDPWEPRATGRGSRLNTDISSLSTR